jgi:hypothetical protein
LAAFYQGSSQNRACQTLTNYKEIKFRERHNYN